jgi:hypothetical protein
MHSEAHIRDLLIKSCHASKDAQAFFESRRNDEELLALLIRIAKDAEDYEGDAPMQAAYYASQFPGSLLLPYEAELRAMLPIVNGYGGHIALALGKTKSIAGKQVILNELGDGTRFDARLFREALSQYESA